MKVMPLSVWLVALATTATLDAGQQPPAQRPSAVTVPAGTTIVVRLTQDIDVDTTAAGTRFKARVDDAVSVNNRVVIPREAGAVVEAIMVSPSGSAKGSDHLSLKLNTVSVGGLIYQVASEYATVEGKGEGKASARKSGGSAGLGAVAGGMTGGAQGVLIGAVAGAAVGTAVASSGQKPLTLPADTRLQFKLTSFVRVEW